MLYANETILKKGNISDKDTIQKRRSKSTQKESELCEQHGPSKAQLFDSLFKDTSVWFTSKLWETESMFTETKYKLIGTHPFNLTYGYSRINVLGGETLFFLSFATVFLKILPYLNIRN